MIGIIPAAGKSTRWSGQYKELLPLTNDITLLDKAISFCDEQGCESVVIITSPEKIATHAQYLSRFPFIKPPVFFKVQDDIRPDFLGAIRCGIQHNSDSFLIVMPDTFFTMKERYVATDAPITFGLFETLHPERFGVLRDGQIEDKALGLFDGQTVFNAWGVIWMNQAVASEIYYSPFENHTSAFNYVMRKYGYETFDIYNYKDFASFQDYKEWLTDENPSISKTLSI
jgi:hypothetical protein